MFSSEDLGLLYHSSQAGVDPTENSSWPLLVVKEQDSAKDRRIIKH